MENKSKPPYGGFFVEDKYMDIWDNITNFFKQAYDSAEYLAEREKEKYKTQAYKQADVFNVKTGESDGPRDAFRHTHSSAQAVQDYGSNAAKIAGGLVEVVGYIKGNPREGRQMDIFNNAVGRELGEMAVKEKWSEARLAYEVNRALEDGRLVQHAKPQGQASILDYYKK